MDYDYDYFVVGAGSGGVRSARIAAGHGARVGIAEEDRVGGTCVIRGCVPKKMLVYGAHFAEDLKNARRFGWDVGTPAFSWPTLRDNVLADVDRINAAYETTLENAHVELRRGRAVFLDPNTLDVGGERVTARHVLIAVGSRPTMPRFEGSDHVISSDETFHLPALPRRIAIAGSGYIANEFAGIFHELGAHVTMIVRGDTILRGWDHSLRERLLAQSMASGIQYRFNCEVERIDADGGTKRLQLSGGETLEADTVLFAIGREPNTGGLGCAAAGIGLDNHGAVMVDEHCETSAPGVFAVGDVINRVQLTPVAIREGQYVADRLFGGGAAGPLDYGCIPSAVFSHPPLASVGLTESDARSRIGDIKVYSSDFRPMKTTLAGRSDRALFKLVVDGATDRLVGAHMIGPEAAEIMQALAIAVKAGLTKAQVDATVAIHPTMAEELVLMR